MQEELVQALSHLLVIHHVLDLEKLLLVPWYWKQQRHSQGPLSLTPSKTLTSSKVRPGGGGVHQGLSFLMTQGLTGRLAGPFLGRAAPCRIAQVAVFPGRVALARGSVASWFIVGADPYSQADSGPSF